MLGLLHDKMYNSIFKIISSMSIEDFSIYSIGLIAPESAR